MPEKEVILTLEGFKKHEKELDQLKTHRRKEIAERIKQAIDFGDISENSEYDDAKDEQAFIEKRIIKLEKMLGNAKVIDDNEKKDKVSLGCTVKLKDMEFGDEEEYTIVGSAEADPAVNKISNESPVGKAVLGHPKDSIVEVEVPVGIIRFQIMDIN
ncbi:MAG: transcription elongation factor GreA [Eubacteriales bacterium]